jgi:hypothetical protein
MNEGISLPFPEALLPFIAPARAGASYTVNSIEVICGKDSRRAPVFRTPKPRDR